MELELTYDISLNLLVALAIGLLIGIERGWSDRDEDEGHRTAGIRTFSIIGLLGGISSMLASELSFWILAAALIAVSAMIIAAHILDVQEDQDVGTTTAFTMILTFILSAWAVLGYQLLALSTTVIVIALLGYKPVLHQWLTRMEEREIYAGIKLLVISVVLLPLLPNEGYGPYDSLNPYWIWWMVVLICTLSFIGYFAIKFAGNRAGTLLTAIFGGLASSTAVTLSFAQFAREHSAKQLFMGGVLFASSIMFIRVIIEVSVVNRALLSTIWIPLAVMFILVIAGGLWLWKHQSNDSSDPEQKINLKNPFQLGMAIKFGALLALILLLSEAVKDLFGDAGIYTLAIVSGLMDVDSITLSLSKMALGDLNPDTASIGIILASATNTLVKGLIFAFLVGLKESMKLILLILFAIIPGLLVAGYLYF
jgi:uncharacterized membrane protein (DUF4010 family)